jgi:hypothetical protein
MGYRAHVITQHRDYGSTMYLRWDEFDAWYADIDDRYNGDDSLILMRSENEEYYEIDKTVVGKEIDRLKELPPEEKIEFSDDEGFRNIDMIERLEVALKEAPETDDYVGFEWF